MALFHLVPVDPPGSPIPLPEGETVLGRGPFFGVSDKRVSRQHGLLESLQGQLRIKPTHLNPCFCQSSLDAPSQPLDRDRWHRLRQGDIISLLPMKYLFQVQAVGGGALRTSPDPGSPDEVHQKKPVSSEPREDPAHPAAPQATVLTSPSPQRSPTLGATADRNTKEPLGPMETDQTEAGRAEEEEQRPEPTKIPEKEKRVEEQRPEKEKQRPDKEERLEEQRLEEKEEQKQTPKKRTLPAWMIAGAVTPNSPSTPKDSGARQTATPVRNTKPTAAKKRGRTTAPSSGEESELSEPEPTPRKRVRKKKKSEEDGPSEPAPKAKRKVAIRRVEDSEESDNIPMELEEEPGGKGGVSSPVQVRGGGVSPPAKDRKGGASSPVQVRGGGVSSPGQDKGSGASLGQGRGGGAKSRTACPFGTSCYRKNPLHFQECSHPGDGDYEEASKEEEEEEEEEDADRPECPYGTDCYRKNPAHWKEYKHSATRAKRSVRKDYKDEEEEEDDDDSFINDDSEDVDEDSDYKPPDSGDSAEEDLKALRKEGRAFINRRK